MDRHTEKPGDVLSALRAATASRHDILDREMPLSRDAPTLSDYRDHLLILRAWLYPLETWLIQFNDGPQREDYLRQSTKIALIDADLAHPSMSAVPESPESIPPASSPQQSLMAPPVDNRFYRWGISYVIEGSQLGGIVLQRRLAARLAPHPLRYLCGGGGTASNNASGNHSDDVSGKAPSKVSNNVSNNISPGQRWTRFLSNLRADVVGDQEISQACDGACHAFDRILALHRQNSLLLG
jgi:heme oxygenase